MNTIAKPLPAETTDAEALDTTWPARESAAKGDSDADAPHSAAERREPGHIDSALESLGEAISDPVREAAEEVSTDTTESSTERPPQPPHSTPQRRS